MHRYSRTVSPVLLAFAIFAAVGSIAAQRKESGSDPYTPTKREWLVLQFNAKSSTFTSPGNFSIKAYEQGKDENTVLLVASAFKDTDRQFVNEAMGFAREHMEGLSKRYCCNSWLIIREEIQVMDVPHK
jgi:hypothetical protein